MAAVNFKPGTRTNLTTTALNSLATGTYVSLGTISLLGAITASMVPLNGKVEVAVTSPATVSGNKQLKVFAKASMDNSNFTSGPTSGTTTTDEPDLIPLGVVFCNTVSAVHRQMFDIAAAFGGTPPSYVQLVALNDMGSTLPASGHSVDYTLMPGDVT